MMQQGTFRADLFYRLSVLPIRVPPLREIREDIPLLVQHLLGKLDLKCRVSAEAMAALQGHHWPGNVRELRNVLERAAILCRGGEIQPKDLYLNEGSTPRVSLETHVSTPAPSLGTLDQQLKDLERTMILEALERNQNNKMKTARELGMPPSTLWRKLKAY
jgi:DNA-binding NtrC family response regulator